jgi:hypothetical protein
MAVALRYARMDYNGFDWKEFYKSLVFIFDLERTLYDQQKEAGLATHETTPMQSPSSGMPRAFSSGSQEDLDILKGIDIAEEQL